MAVGKQKRTKRKSSPGNHLSFLSRLDMRAIFYALFLTSFLFFTVGALFYVVFFDR